MRLGRLPAAAADSATTKRKIIALCARKLRGDQTPTSDGDDDDDEATAEFSWRRRSAS